VIEDGRSVAGASLTSLGSASPGELGAPLGAGFVAAPTSRYVVHYLSQVPFGEHEVELTIKVDGVGIVDLDYAAPKAAPALIANRPKPKSFWTSSVGLVAIASVVALLVALALVILMIPRRRRSALRRRVGEFTASLPHPEELRTQHGPSALAGLERVLARMGWWPRFKENVGIARMRRSAVELVAITATVTVAVSVLIGSTVGAPALSFVLFPLGPLALQSIVRHRVRKQRELFGDQLAPMLEEVGSAMRAGHGLVSGLTAAVHSAAEPSRTEWGRVLADEQLGVPLDAAMNPLARRMASTEVEQVALVAALHHRTGGNMAEVLDRVADGVRERAELRRELHALTAQARLSRWVVSLLPPAVLGVVEIVNPDYLRPLFKTTGGMVMLAVAVGMLILGSLVMRKMTEIEV
jgi:tight adherence protein B